MEKSNKHLTKTEKALDQLPEKEQSRNPCSIDRTTDRVTYVVISYWLVKIRTESRS